MDGSVVAVMAVVLMAAMFAKRAMHEGNMVRIDATSEARRVARLKQRVAKQYARRKQLEKGEL